MSNDINVSLNPSLNINAQVSAPVEVITQIIGSGPSGKSLEFDWRGTELGVRVVGAAEYQYVNLGNFYRHDQMPASNSWLIVHGLGRYPSVTIIDSADSLVFGEVHYIDSNTVRVDFSASFGGIAYLV